MAEGPPPAAGVVSALVGWAAVRSQQGLMHSSDPELAMFAAMCGRGVELAGLEDKQRDLVATWREVLTGHGIATA